MEKNVVIKVENLKKYFKVRKDKNTTLMETILFAHRNKTENHIILDNITFEIYKGETVALLGTNGSGKSTMLKLISKILYPNEGKVTTNGKVTSLLELGAGFHPDFTGRENIYFNASIFGLTREEIDSRLNDIIEFSELGEYIDTPVRTYSSGMYLRLAFSVAINVSAEILLIDEILAVGDQRFQEKCMDKIKELTKSGMTIVFVSHTLSSIKELCSRVIWFYNGKIEMDGKANEVIDMYLDRINLDAINRLKNSKGLIEYSGKVFIDHPKTNYKISKNEENINIIGWAMCDDDESVLEVTINGELFSHYRYERADVLNVHNTDFGGGLLNEKPGFIVELNLNDIKQHEILIKAIMKNRYGKKISSSESHITIID